MGKKRKTVPKDFEEVLTRGDTEEIKSILQKCEPDATYDYQKNSVLSHKALPEEIMIWLVRDYGADINYAGTYGDTALSEAACWQPEKIDLLLSLGADIDFHTKNDGTALFKAAFHHRPEGVRRLIEKGADMAVTCTWTNDNALESALSVCQPIDIKNTAEIARIFLEHGMQISEKMKNAVRKIGEEFEFHRDGFNPDDLEETDAALQELYRMFDVPPVPKRVKFDGSTPIQVKTKTFEEQYNELWNMLVPGSGKSDYLQGEAIRLIGKLSYEVLDMGGVNWEQDHRNMCDALAGYLSTGKAAAKDMIDKVKHITPDTDEQTFLELSKTVVKWILDNPDPLPLGRTNYRR